MVCVAIPVEAAFNSYLVGVRDVHDRIRFTVTCGYLVGAGQGGNEDLLPYLVWVGCCHVIGWEV